MLNHAIGKVCGMYHVLRDECLRMKRSNITHMLVSRRLQDDGIRQAARVDQLSAARIYLMDKIDDQAEHVRENEKTITRLTGRIESLEKTIAKLEGEVGISEVKKDASEQMDPKDYQLAKDARIRAISDAVTELKSKLSWGQFSGTGDELDSIFEEVQQLL
jgi:predicted RNase H-like nuclease (RuvC/YqgF family)